MQAPHPFHPRRWRHCTTALFCAAAASGCATQAPHVPPPLHAPAAWSEQRGTGVIDYDITAPDAWWSALDDHAVHVLVPAALADSPTVAQAIARVDEADAHLNTRAAQRKPTLQLDVGAARTREPDRGETAPLTAATLGLNLRWEIDLFGRVRNDIDGARHRLDARTADAAAARLSLAARVADTVLSLRGCRFARAVLLDDIGSRETTLELSRHHLAAGAMAAVDVARAQAGLAAARTTLALRQQQCDEHTNALVALTGVDSASITALMDAPVEIRAAAPSPRNPESEVQGPSPTLPLYAQWVMPRAPGYRLRLPAAILARHPGVRAAEAELEAAWADIAVARAERLPRLDVGAALSGQWLRAAGDSGGDRNSGWSIGPALSVPLFDGGQGAANVAANEARYRIAAAVLHGAIRDAARDVENALAASRSAHTRLTTTRAAADAAQATFDAAEAMWRAGASSLFVLEDTRRQLASAQNDAIAAVQDSSQAWVALALACGGSPLPPEGTLE